ARRHARSARQDRRTRSPSPPPAAAPPCSSRTRAGRAGRGAWAGEASWDDASDSLSARAGNLAQPLRDDWCPAQAAESLQADLVGVRALHCACVPSRIFGNVVAPANRGRRCGHEGGFPPGIEATTIFGRGRLMHRLFRRTLVAGALAALL